MAKIVFGAGVSHSVVLALSPEEWGERSFDDMKNPELNLSDGRLVTYEELEKEFGAIHEDVAKFEVYQQKAQAAQACLDRVADDLEKAAPDVVLIIGDDQEELFSRANQPTIAIYYGEELITNDHYNTEGNPNWMRKVSPGYAMDICRSFPAAPQFGLEVINGLVDRGVDVSTVAEIVDAKEAGFGHAFGFVIQRLFRGRSIPVLPVLLNTYYPPNVPTAARCYEIGKALRGAIEGAPTDLRVAVMASGGLSHFVVDEELDQRVLDGLSTDGETLRSIPRGALNSGSSEILNWVMVAGAIGKAPLRWRDYYPIYRTPAGTGVGVAFAVWDLPDEG